MITIGITVCDSDYKNLDNLLKQIEERVEPEHEIIIVDNREKFKDDPVFWKADWTPGYNVYQFEARRRIVDMAQGEYIWFVDGDDEILELLDEGYTEDIIAYSFYAYPDRYYKYCDEVITQNILSIETTNKIGCTLWNKLIKKSLLENYEGIIPKNHAAVTWEDVTWLTFALSNAKNVRLSPQIIYSHTLGTSNLSYIKSPDVAKIMFTGYQKTQKIMRKILANKPEMYDISRRAQSDFLASYILKMSRWHTDKTKDNIIETTRLVIQTIDRDILVECLQKNVISKMPKKWATVVIDEMSKELGYDNIWPVSEISETYWDEEAGQWKERKQKVVHEIIYFEEKPQLNKKLSIVSLFCDNDVQYLDDFIRMIEERVKIDHEVIIVDNREDKTKPVKVPFNVKLIETELGNVGILNGRRLGVNNAAGDYIWLVDIDDEISIVDDDSWSDADMIVFPFINYDNALLFADLRETVTENLWSKEVLVNCTTNVWNKWVRSDILKRAYARIPSFECYNHEDVVVYFSEMEDVKSIKFQPFPIYKYIRYNTTANIATKKAVDKSFLNFDKAEQFLTRYSDHKEVMDEYHSGDAGFYLLVMMERTSPEQQQYFAELMERYFDHKAILRAIDINGWRKWSSSAFELFKKYDDTPKICDGSGNLELNLQFDSQTIKLWKCCRLRWQDRLGEISINEFLALKNKREWLETRSKFIPSGHKYFRLNTTGPCFGCQICDYSKFPLKRISVINGSCNFNCTMCRDGVYYSKEEIDNYFEILESIRGLGLEELYLTTGGEPFLQKERAIKYIESLTEKDFKTVSCITNASTLDDEDIERLAMARIKTHVMVSIDAISEETNLKTRRNPFFKKIEHNILEFNRHGMLRALSILITEYNLHEFNDMPEYWMSRGIELEQLSFLICEDLNLVTASNSEKKVMESKEMERFRKRYPMIQLSAPGDNIYNV